MAYIRPLARIFQVFEEQPASIDQPLPACVVGEQFNLHRYTESSEKAGTKVSDSYDPDSDNCWAWPNRQAGERVDPGYTKVYLENALLEYLDEPAGDVNPIALVAGTKNRIRSANFNWATANGYTRDARLLRDVKVGDTIKVTGVVLGEPIVKLSEVVGLLADQVAAAIGTPYNDAANVPAGTAAQGFVKETVDNTVDIASLGTAYDGLTVGRVSEIYTVECIAGGLPGAALLRITSQSGLDDVAQISPEAFGDPTDIGTLGATATFTRTGGDEFEVGQTWTVTVEMDYDPCTLAAGGTYNGATNTTYVLTVTRGGLFGASPKPLVTISTTTGVDISGPVEIDDAIAFVIGTQGTTFTLTGVGANQGLALGDRFYVAVEAVKDGPVKTLVLADNLDQEVVDADPDLAVVLYIKKNMELTEGRIGFSPLVNWVQSATELCINSGAIGYDSEWASGGIEQPLPIKDATVYLNYRGRLSTWCSTRGSVTAPSQVAGLLGPTVPDNPLSYATYKAALNANGEETFFLGVCAAGSGFDLTLDDWNTALDILTGGDSVYSLIPCSTDVSVLDAFAGHIDAESTPDNGRWRIGFFTNRAEETQGVYTTSRSTTGSSVPGDPVLATITDDPDTSGTQYTWLEATGEKFMDAGVRPGDVVRANYTTDGFGNFTYSEFVVDEVINQETIRLVSGPSSPISIPSKIEIWRVLSKDELVDQLILLPGRYSNRRIALVWPDLAEADGTQVDSMHLCAALGGLRSASLPHQPLTNVEIAGFEDMTRSSGYFSESQLDRLAAAGWWIVVRDRKTGRIYTRHQLSTGDPALLKQREQSITSNLDHMSYVLLAEFEPFIGKTNVTPSMLQALRGRLVARLDEFSTVIADPMLGPQLVTLNGIPPYQILQLEPDPVFADHVIGKVRVRLPAPFNNFDLTLIA